LTKVGMKNENKNHKTCYVSSRQRVYHPIRPLSPKERVRIFSERDRTKSTKTTAWKWNLFKFKHRRRQLTFPHRLRRNLHPPRPSAPIPTLRAPKQAAVNPSSFFVFSFPSRFLRVEIAVVGGARHRDPHLRILPLPTDARLSRASSSSSDSALSLAASIHTLFQYRGRHCSVEAKNLNESHCSQNKQMSTLSRYAPGNTIFTQSAPFHHHRHDPTLLRCQRQRSPSHRLLHCRIHALMWTMEKVDLVTRTT